MNWLDYKYVLLAGGRCRNFKKVSETVFQFSCPLCGDSRRHPRKARGYFTEKHGDPIFTCHKQCGTMSFFTFLMKFDSNMYAEYKKERVVSGFWKPQPAAVRPATGGEEAGSVVPPTDLTRGDPLPRDLLRPLYRVDALEADHYSRQVCESRKLPDLSRVYHCPKFYAWTNWVLKEDKFSKKALFYDHPRLIIPFFDKSGRLTTFQGRDYRVDSDNKYVTIRVDEDFPEVYGLDRYDPEKTGYAVEGPIDSMFVDNCIAFAGGNHAVLSEVGFRGAVVYDNEPKSKGTRKKIQKAIEDGFPVVIWPNWVEQKDINDMVKAGVNVTAVLKARTFSGLLAEEELRAWRG